jgi:glycolate oxidase
MLPAGLKEKLAAVVGPKGWLDRPEDLALYEYDGSVDKHRPDLVVFPRTTEQVSAIARLAHENKVPLVGRGAGTGSRAAPSRGKAASAWPSRA